jgi:cell division protein FtsQ
MRARRRRHVEPEPPPRRHLGAGAPKLATIKLEGNWAGPPKITRNGLVGGLAACVLAMGAAVAGAAWLGGSLFDAHEAFAQRADAVVAAAGFAARYEVEGVADGRRAEVLAAAAEPGRASLLAADPRAIKARVESLDWVAHAKVQRRWPNTLRIEIERRAAFARWQENGHVSVIDAAGERLFAERAADHPELPLVVGQGAGAAAHDLLIALEELPRLRDDIVALVRVGARRWDIELDSGARIALPEEGAVLALTRFDALAARRQLLARPVALYDLRAPGQLRVVAAPGLLGGGDAASGV